MSMKAGKYWVGDPCYVMGDRNGFGWGSVIDQTRCFEDRGDGEFSVKKEDGAEIKIAAFGTCYGDGVYGDNFDNRYGVDAGLIGCVPVEAIDLNAEALRLGTVHEFPEDFVCSEDEGTLTFGHVIVYTGDYSPDDTGGDEEE